MIADRKKQSEAKRVAVVGSEKEQAKERFAFFSGCVRPDGPTSGGIRTYDGLNQRNAVLNGGPAGVDAVEDGCDGDGA